MDNNLIYNKNRYFFIIVLFFTYIIRTCAQNTIENSALITGTDTLPVITSLDATSFKIDTVFSNRIYKENSKLIPSSVNIYDLPYSIKGHHPNYKRLALNTGVLFGAGVVTLGVLYLLPEGATAWNKEETINVPPFKRWWRNVKKGPVVDKDNFVFNYILHPYGGAAYYMSARSLGFNFYYSALYATSVSTFFWEYGIEAFMEIPSIQDLLITPIVGTFIGEGFYRIKRHIVTNGYTLIGSSFLGNVVAYLVDPVNEVIGIFAGNPNRRKYNSASKSLACLPWFNTTKNNATFGFTVSLIF